MCEEPRCKITNYVNGTSTFTITDIQAEDAGAYSCEIQNKIDRIFAVDTIVTIIDCKLSFVKIYCNFNYFFQLYNR